MSAQFLHCVEKPQGRFCWASEQNYYFYWTMGLSILHWIEHVHCVSKGHEVSKAFKKKQVSWFSFVWHFYTCASGVNVRERFAIFQIESDLSFVSGASFVTVWPGKSADYEMIVAPLRRGHYQGTLAFVSGSNPVKWVNYVY